MTAAEVRDKLYEVREAAIAYRLAAAKAKAYKQMLIGGKSVKYTDGVIGERKGNPAENAYCILADYNAEADKLLQDMNKARQRAEELIGSLSDKAQKEVLTRRYIIGQRWEEISEEMNYSARRIFQIHTAAIKNISVNFIEFQYRPMI